MQGALLVDKPKTWTSFDVVNYVRKMARQQALVESYQVHTVESEKRGETLDFATFQLSSRLPKVKVGHTGTLDPLATGLLVLLIGKEYTRKATELTKLDKTYDVTLKLGETSTTGDAEGQITPYCHSEQSEESSSTKGRSFDSSQDDKPPALQAIEEALHAFTGEIMQTPPAFSAIKVDGKRAYDLAREGKEVKLAPRPVTIYGLKLTKYEYPYVEFTADVSSGTYIRSLAEDLGNHLGTGAYMSDLRRTRIAEFDISDAVTVEGLDADKVQKHLVELS